MADIAQLEEQIVSLSLLEAAALVKKLEERLGVSAAAAAPVAVAAAGGGAAAPVAEEKTEFQVILKDAGANKINTIKAVTRPRTRPRPSGRSSRAWRPSKSSNGKSKRHETCKGRRDALTCKLRVSATFVRILAGMVARRRKVW
jgi:CheY-like chemotaxis protein